MSEKETNLCVSADVTDKKVLLDLCDKVGPHICVLKTHLDILNDFDKSVVSQLQGLAKQHGFLILEDRKFADIGSTVLSQYRDGYLKIADWADLVTVHGVAGAGTIQGLKEVGIPKGRACVLLAEMSSSGNLIDETYKSGVLRMAREHSDFVLGFVAQSLLRESLDFVCFTPGIGLAKSKEVLGQNYKDPKRAVCEQGSDVIIVGRHIYNAEDPEKEARQYRQLGWEGYLERIQERDSSR
jgi:orotidine 5'-phosphate decarboxylase subfamily 1